MNTLFYMQEQRLYRFSDGRSEPVTCQAVEQYIGNLKQIHRKKEWKTQGSGADFMGIRQEGLDLSDIHPSDSVCTADGRLVYGATLQGGAAIQAKPINDLAQAEGLLLRHTDCTIYDMAYDAAHERLALSLAGDCYGDRHLAVMPLSGNRFQFITEGECRDSNPCFDPKNGNILYYDSCGLAYTDHGALNSIRSINRLNLSDGELETVLHDEQYDFFMPQPDHAGNLYCIRKPHREEVQKQGNILRDILLIPFKLFKAMFGWLDFFSQRYGGESLRTSGANPAKSKQQSEEERFIEGNLVKVRRRRDKEEQNERYPSAIPKSWQLVKYTPEGGCTVLHSGVMAYTLCPDGGIIYSNGRYILHATAEGEEKMLTEARWASKLRLQPQTFSDGLITT